MGWLIAVILAFFSLQSAAQIQTGRAVGRVPGAAQVSGVQQEPQPVNDKAGAALGFQRSPRVPRSPTTRVGSPVQAGPTTKVNPPITVEPPIQPLDLQLSADKTSVHVGDQVNFTLAFVGSSASAMSSTAKASLVCKFDFGDRTTASKTGAIPVQVSHPFQLPGNYTVSVEAQILIGREARVPPLTRTVSVAVRASLYVEPTQVRMGDEVSFRTDPAAGEPNIKYRFWFNDESKPTWIDQPQASHAYAADGSYSAKVEIGRANGTSIDLLGDSDAIPVTVTRLPSNAAALSVNPESQKVGEAVTFTVKFDSKSPSIRYRFLFGDGSTATQWSADPRTTHAYGTAETYSSDAEVGVESESGVKSIARTEAVRITITPVPGGSPGQGPRGPGRTPRPGVGPGPGGGPDAGLNSGWTYLIAGVAALFVLVAAALLAGHRARTRLERQRLTFVSHPDAGRTQFPGGHEPGIDFQILLDPDVAEADYRISTPERSLIRSERRHNG